MTRETVYRMEYVVGLLLNDSWTLRQRNGNWPLSSASPDKIAAAHARFEGCLAELRALMRTDPEWGTPDA